MRFREKRKVMDAGKIDRTLEKICRAIIKKCKTMDELVIIGIRTRGAYLAERIAKKIEAISGDKVLFGILDITLYRDDLTTIASQPVVHKTEIPFDMTGKKVILVDDVLYTGRTIRAGVDELIDFGRPASIQAAILIDRGHRELPIRADYVGESVKTSEDEIVEVQINEVDDKEQVVIVEKDFDEVE